MAPSLNHSLVVIVSKCPRLRLVLTFVDVGVEGGDGSFQPILHKVSAIRHVTPRRYGDKGETPRNYHVASPYWQRSLDMPPYQSSLAR